MPSLKRKDDFVVYVVTLSNMKRYISIEFIGDMRVHHRSKGTAFRHLRYARQHGGTHGYPGRAPMAGT